MKKIFRNLSMQKKVAIILIITIIAVTAVGIFALNKLEKNEVKVTSANVNNLGLQEDIVPVVKEEVIQVSQDNSIDESLIEEEEKEEKEIEVAGKKVAVPKSKVAPVNSKEDPENNKEKGGAEMTQEQATQMFENVGAQSNGIDVSAHQGKIDWAAVKASNVDFAMIRCGFRGYGTGAICEDAYFKTNVNNAVANGIKVGIYFYSAAINEQEALEEAVWVISKIKTYRITYPVVYDFEDFQRHRCANVDGAQATRNAITFFNLIKQAGYEPMMYASKNDITNKMSRSSFNGYKFWLAHYTSGGLATPTDYKGSYQMWQYTSKGRVNGINGNVDMNIAFFSYGATAAPKHTHAFTELVRNSLKEATCFREGSKTMRCSCGDTQVEVLPKTKHKFGNWEITKPATEQEEGLKVRKCQNQGCTEQETQKIPKLKPSTNTNTNTNTENKVGNNTSVENKVDEPKHTEHTWIQDPNKTNIEPTCTEPGKKFLKCSECTETKEEELKPIGHKPGEWIIDQPATETEEGKQHRECTICKEIIETGIIPVLKSEEKETPVSE